MTDNEHQPAGILQASPDSDEESRTEPPKRRGFFRRHLVLTSLASILVVICGLAIGFAFWANHQLAAIPRVDAGIDTDSALNHNEAGHPLNLLLLGTDNGDSDQSVSDELEDGQWSPGQFRSDTIMVVHVPADRRTVQLISIPRDIWVPIDGYGNAKINAAFSYGGPSLARQTIEQFTGLTMNHMAMIDWDGFSDVTNALGGVRVYVPESFRSLGNEWEKGWQTMDGEEALKYVRTRYNIPGDNDGDFGRIARQQNFLRTVMDQSLSSSTTHNPFRFTKLLSTVTSQMTVDDSWDTDEIRDLAWAMRQVRSGDVQFVTVPFGSYGTSSDGQSYVRPAMPATKQLFADVSNDDIEKYLGQHPDDELPNELNVN